MATAPSLAAQLAAVHSWWSDAGVDFAFEDEPQAMLRAAKPEPRAAIRTRMPAAEPETVPVVPRIDPASLPGDLAAFREWWCDPAMPLSLPAGPRLAPLGAAGARLMLLAPMPEAEDSAQIFGGAQGRLLRNMLAALGLSEAEAYFATALPLAMNMPDWDGLAEAGLGTIIAHHIALARPERVLVMGNALAPLVAGIETPRLATFAPEQLLAHPRQCARLWARLLDWMPPA